MAPQEDQAAVADSRQFPCGKCGAELAFRPGTTTLVCGYCGFTNEIEAADVETWELDYRVYVERLEGEAPTEGRHELVCASCKARVQPAAHVTSMSCPYCDANLVNSSVEHRTIRPALLLPFQVTHETAYAAYRKWVTSRWFAPTKVKRFARSDRQLAGLYVPYWTYDSRTTSSYTGMRGEYYWVTVGTGKNRRRERKTRWYPAAGTVQNEFDDLLVLGSVSLPQPYADRLDPWDLANLVPYAAEYVAGFAAESYQVGLVDGFGVAAERMQPVIRSTIRSDIGGDTQQVHHVDTHYDDITFKHILLPVWMSTFLYRDRLYRFIINGRTGEVQGQRPWSWVKIALAIAGGLAAAGVIVAIVTLASR